MSWRTVVVTGVAKLDYSLNYLTVRQKDKESKIYLGEIGTLIIDTTMASLTTALLCELTKNKIKVIFCDEKHNPQNELLPYCGTQDSTRRIRDQLEWDEDVKKRVWAEIVKEKIRQQMLHLSKEGFEEQANMLKEYIKEVEPGDITNREGHAAKVYFNKIFTTEFSRSQENVINAILDYGYAIILSAFNRAIAASGYLTQLGIFHRNVFNPFNLASDLMEPYRILVDRKAVEMKDSNFGRVEKMQLVKLLEEEVTIENKHQTIDNAVGIYCRSVFEALKEGDVSLIQFYKDEKLQVYEDNSIF